MRKLWTVLKFEYTHFVKSKSYIITTIFFVAVFAILLNIPRIAGLIDSIRGNDTAASDGEIIIAGIIDDEGFYPDEILMQYLPEFQWNPVGSREAASSLVEGEYALVLEIKGTSYTIFEKGSEGLMGGMSHYDRIEDMIRFAYQKSLLQNADIAPAQIDELLNIQLEASFIAVGKDLGQTFWLGYVLLFLMYFCVIFYGQSILTSVVTEKSSKAMELLITSAKPSQLMFGKVFGVGLAGLTQFLVFILSTAVLLMTSKDAWQVFSPAVAAVMNLSASSSLLIFVVIYFLLGFFAYACLFAGFGSTVSRMENASASAQIPMFLFVIVFFISFQGLMNPEAAHIFILSFVPFFSPLVMFARICTTEVPAIQIAISIVINIVTVVISGIVNAKIYRMGVLLYGKTPSLREIFKQITKA